MGAGKKEPELDNFVKKLSQNQSKCTEELRALFECMLRNSMVDVDQNCGRQRAALALCAQKSAGKGARSKIASELKRVASLWKKFGY